MTGLLLKDFYSLRSYFLKQLSLMAILYLIISIVLQSVALLAPMMVLGIAMILLSSFSADEASKWDSYAHTLPLSAGKLVGAKYILFLGSLLFGTAIVSVLCCVMDSLFFHQGAMPIVLSAAAVTGLYMLVSVIILPIFFKYGAEKGRMLMTLVYMIPFFAVIWGNSYISKTSGLDVLLHGVPWVLLVVCLIAIFAAVCILSFFISVHIYRNKEF